MSNTHPLDQSHERSRRLPVSVLMPVLNEERNIADALRSVSWADEVFVVDSHSTDRTAAIAASMGATVVQFDYMPGGPKKMNWSLDNLPFANEWVLIIAADERITADLRLEIEAGLSRRSADGFLLAPDYVFMGRSLRCMRPSWALRLFKHALGRIEDLGLDSLPGTGDIEVHEHVALNGKMEILRAPMLHNDYRGITPWLERHNRYATWEAHLSLQLREEPLSLRSLLRFRQDPIAAKRALRRIWVRLPFRPLLGFCVYYVLRGGYRDGMPGLIYSTLMGFHQLIIMIKIGELEIARRADAGRVSL